MVLLMFKIQTFCQVFLSSGTKNLKAKWIFYIICHLCVAKSYSQTQHLLYLELDGKLHLISFGHHILVVGQQGRKLARIIQASTEDMWDLFDQTLKQKRYHTSWPSSWPVSYSCWVFSVSNHVHVREIHNLGLVTVVLVPRTHAENLGHVEDLIFNSVQFSRSVVSDSLLPDELHHARPPCPSPTPGVHPASHPSSWWCHPAISSSVIPFSSCPQSLPSSGSFPMSQLFPWGGHSIGVSASASVLPMNTQDRSPLGWTGWISLQSKRLSRVFSNTTVQKHQFFCTQLSSQSKSHIHTWPLEKP